MLRMFTFAPTLLSFPAQSIEPPGGRPNPLRLVGGTFKPVLDGVEPGYGALPRNR